MQDSPLVLNNDKLARNQPHKVEYTLIVTGAKASRQPVLLQNPVILTGYDAATTLTQAGVDAFLGIASTIPCATCFDATSLGTDAIGFVLNMAAQVDKVIALEVSGQLGGTALVPVFLEASQVALTSSLSSAVAAADGNIYGRLVLTGLDAATAGHISIKPLYKSK